MPSIFHEIDHGEGAQFRRVLMKFETSAFQRESEGSGSKELFIYCGAASVWTARQREMDGDDMASAPHKLTTLAHIRTELQD